MMNNNPSSFKIVLPCLFVFGWFVVFSSTAYGQTTAGEEARTSSLLVLMAATDEASVKVERQLVAELRLTLDGLQVEQIVIERKDFLSITLPEQLEVVQPLIRRFQAKAAVWVTSGGTSGHLIQFVVSEQGNATVRTVEAGAPEELALAVSELLEQTYLFDPTQSLKEKVKKTPWLYMGVDAGLSGGIYGHRGESVIGGVALQARFRFLKGFFGGIFLEGMLGPRQNEGRDGEDGKISGWRVAPGLFTTFLASISRVSVGPLLEVSATYTTLNAMLGPSDYTTDGWWAFRGALGLELNVSLTDMFSIFLDATIGGISTKEGVVRQSSGVEVLSTPFLDYSINIGVITGVL